MSSLFVSQQARDERGAINESGAIARRPCRLSIVSIARMCRRSTSVAGQSPFNVATRSTAVARQAVAEALPTVIRRWGVDGSLPGNQETIGGKEEGPVWTLPFRRDPVNPLWLVLGCFRIEPVMGRVSSHPHRNSTILRRGVLPNLMGVFEFRFHEHLRTDKS